MAKKPKITIILIALLLTIAIRPCYASGAIERCINPMSFSLKHDCTLYRGDGIGRYACNSYNPHKDSYFLTTDCKGNVVKYRIKKHLVIPFLCAFGFAALLASIFIWVVARWTKAIVLED